MTAADTLEMQETDKPEKVSPPEATLGWNVVVISVAEMLGTATFMFVGCMGCIHDAYPAPVYQFSPFSFGLAVALAIQLFGHISGGHFNAPVTVAAYIMGHTKLIMVPFYIISQFIGAMLGYGLILLVTPADLTEGLCVTTPKHGISDVQALAIETVITALLILAICSVWDYRCAGLYDSVSIRLGLMLSAIFIAAAPFTGSGLNPARSLAPAILQNEWTSHWVYWVGPMVGGLVGTYLYKYTFLEGLSKLGSNKLTK